MHHKVLIVGTMPFNPNTQSRAFNSYFKNWEPENLRQIFSDPRRPIKGHCGSLYQLTDARILKRKFRMIKEPGVIFQFNDLNEKSDNSNDSSNYSCFFSWLYKIGSFKNSLNRLLRKWLWKRKYWETSQLVEWLDEFQPECVFLAFSDDFFINEIAIFVAERFNIPIMCCIGDDYYFNDRKSLSPFYHIYRKKYKSIINQVFSHKCSAIYIGEKIKEKYNSHFNINGDVVYLSSDIKRRSFKAIDRDNPYITYCGNIRLGRNKSLSEIGKALYNINRNYKLIVYSSEKSKSYTRCLTRCPGIIFKGPISYEHVKEEFYKSDIVVIVEGFRKKDINITRYSLSTKAADSISSGAQIITYGPIECGVVDYMQSTGCSVVCLNKESLVPQIHELITNLGLQKKLYEESDLVYSKNHVLATSNSVAEKLICELIEK